jgi:hypothetical protein
MAEGFLINRILDKKLFLRGVKNRIDNYKIILHAVTRLRTRVKND